MPSGMPVLLIVTAALQSGGAPAVDVATINGWTIQDNRGRCSASTMYDRTIFVRVAYDVTYDGATFFIANPAWESVRNDGSYRVRAIFNNGSEYTDDDARGYRQDIPSGRITGIVMNFDGSDFVEDFALASSVRVDLAGIRLEALSLRGTRAVAMRLARCAAESARRHPADPFASVAPNGTRAPAQPPNEAQPARARANLPSYFSDADYPAAAIRAGEQGTTVFRLTVGPDGRVTNCVVTSSSGSSALDSATCRIMRSRARFTPARDAAGNAATDTVSSHVRWVLPAPEPPPLPPG